jgi:hypothetical protein
VARQVSRNDGLRELLIAERDAFRERWRQPRPWDHPGKDSELSMLIGSVIYARVCRLWFLPPL